MEDRLEEAIHVLRSHAVGQGLEGAPDMHSLLSAVHNGGLGGLSPAFPNASLALSNRHPAMVSRAGCKLQVFIWVLWFNFIANITSINTSGSSTRAVFPC